MGWALALIATALAQALLAAPTLPDGRPDAADEARASRTAVAGPIAHVVVALGDSVPSGAACACRPFPALYGELLAGRTGTSVTVHNYAANGLTTAGLLAQLAERSVADSVRGADVVPVTIGANDFADHHDEVVGGSCDIDMPSDCVTDELDSMRAHLAQILAEIRGLRRGAPTTVLVTGYWNVFEDGDVAHQRAGTSGLHASIALTSRVNAAIRSDATRAGVRYVDLFTPFQSRGHDITRLLAPDGDHPDAAGHRLIASTLLDVGLPRAAWS